MIIIGIFLIIGICVIIKFCDYDDAPVGAIIISAIVLGFTLSLMLPADVEKNMISSDYLSIVGGNSNMCECATYVEESKQFYSIKIEDKNILIDKDKTIFVDSKETPKIEKYLTKSTDSYWNWVATDFDETKYVIYKSKNSAIIKNHLIEY